MKEKKFTSTEWLILAISLFYTLLIFLAGLGIDLNHVIMNKNNIFAGIGELLQIPQVAATSGMLIMLFFFCLYLEIFIFVCILIHKVLKEHNTKKFSFKGIIYYLAAFVVAFGLAFATGALFLIPTNGAAAYPIGVSYTFASILVATIFFLVLLIIVYGIVGIFRYVLEKKSVLKSSNTEQKSTENEEKEDEGIDVSKMFDHSKGEGSLGFSNGQVNVLGDNNEVLSKALPKKEELFKNLTSIDDNFDTDLSSLYEASNISLKELLDGLHGYLASKEKLYYDKTELALFIAGLKASKLIILEGLSGTGKSSLPRFFAKYIGEEAYFESIQVTYKEKSDLLGYYNELTNRYNETPFLTRLYEATYKVNHLNLMVLDEMNISRIEYYFADFLSVMEFPENERYISLMVLPKDYDAPTNLIHGNLQITPNTTFIGTANKDDSTFTITDKVIDRSIIIDFEESQKEFKVDKEYDPINLSMEGLNDLFNKALNEYKFEDNEKTTFNKLTEFIFNEFDIAIGNRSLKQLDILVPLFKGMDMDYSLALDAFLVNKVLRKLDSKYGASFKNQLNKLTKLIDETYGKSSFKNTRKFIARYLRRYE